MGNPRRSNGARRDKIRQWVLATYDECAICGEPVDKSLGCHVGSDGRRRWHPMSAVVDEIVPVSKGGSPYRKENCQLAHRICNLRKGNRTPVTMKPFEVSRDW